MFSGSLYNCFTILSTVRIVSQKKLFYYDQIYFRDLLFVGPSVTSRGPIIENVRKMEQFFFRSKYYRYILLFVTDVIVLTKERQRKRDSLMML